MICKTFLQETHMCDAETFKFIEKTFLTYNFYYSCLTEKNSRGVAICMKKSEKFNDTKHFFDSDNRVYGLEISVNNQIYNLINIYSPNSCVEQNIFINSLYNILHKKTNIILGGDFNFMEERESENSNVKNWSLFFRHFNLEEFGWMNGLEKKNCITWSNGHQFSRIDRMYASNQLVNKCKYKEILETSMSDHRMVVTEVSSSIHNNNNNRIRKKLGLWKLNESILQQDYIQNKVKNICTDIPLLIENYGYVWYDVFIEKITKYFKRESRVLHNKQQENINNFFTQIKELDHESLSEENNNKKNNIRKEIENYYETVRRGNEKRVRDDRLKFIKQPKKVLVNEEIKRNTSCNIKEYITERGEKTSDPEKIKNDIYKYYHNLLGQDKITREKINKYNFNIKSMSVSDHLKEFINKKITYDEAWNVIKEMKESAPGSTGLTIGFYKIFFPYFGHYFVDMLNSENELPSLFKESIVKLIPKNNNTVKSVNDLRPISLTNIDYRVYTKIIANRLRLIGESVIGDHQTCSIRGRRIDDNINLIRDIIHESNNSENELYILSVDQSKAFDRMSHKYLFKLLEHMNFGDFIFNSIKKLYNNSFCKFIVNNSISEKILIMSGLKQGCALSMFLYILCIEELIIRIKQHKSIEGFLLSTYTKREQCKAAGYADDISGFLKSLSSIYYFFQEFNEWGDISGAILNESKTKILALNSIYSEYKEIKFVKELKILGIDFNKQGIALITSNRVIEKANKSFNIWNGVQLNMLERITVVRTFILSKLWYVTNFVVIKEEQIKQLDRLCHKFIWNGSIERIKRATLSLPYDEGGLNMVNIRAKIQTIMIQNFINVVKNKERIFYQLSVKYLKFLLKDFNLTNFNIIPVADNKPLIYVRMSNEFKKYRIINSNIINNMNKITSKQIYNDVIKKYQLPPKVENKIIFHNWPVVYKKIHSVSENSILRVFLYKLLLDALTCNLKFNKVKNRCFFCQREKESSNHLFFKCKHISTLFAEISYLLENQNFTLSKNNFWFSISLSKHDYRTISIFLYSVWLTRNEIKNNKNNLNLKTLFIYFFRKNITSL